MEEVKKHGWVLLFEGLNPLNQNLIALKDAKVDHHLVVSFGQLLADQPRLFIHNHAPNGYLLDLLRTENQKVSHLDPIADAATGNFTHRQVEDREYDVLALKLVEGCLNAYPLLVALLKVDVADWIICYQNQHYCHQLVFGICWFKRILDCFLNLNT